jgi:aspartate carbamoyltransferase catalytic subunit
MSAKKMPRAFLPLANQCQGSLRFSFENFLSKINAMKNLLRKRSIISIADLSKEEILLILKRAEEMKKKSPKELLKSKILASCFYEPSTRTRLSFESAMIRLGGSVIGFSDSNSTSAKKGESLQDAMKIMGQYADVLILRHPNEGAARLASESTDKPVINAGDGVNQHPTQTLLDLFTIKECQNKLKALNLAFVGDLKFGRTVHSLTPACGYFDMRLFFVSPEQLTLPEEISHSLKKQGIKFSFHRTIDEVLNKVDILYMTRIQKERLDTSIYEECKDSYILREEMLKKAKKNLKILHPLPRVNEIETTIDKTPFAYYFQQAENGLYIRMALLSLILESSQG